MALGDSITAGNPAFDPDPQQRAAPGFGDDERSQYESWSERADDSLDLRNCGVFGERTVRSPCGSTTARAEPTR